jgi:hypothetical protein
MSNDGYSRRRTLALVAGLVAALTVGFGRRGPDDDRVVLTVDRGPDPDGSAPGDDSTERPDPAGEPTGTPGGRTSGRSDGVEGRVVPPDDSDHSPRRREEGSDPPSAPRPESDLIVASTDPLEFSDALLGDAGLVPVTLTLSGGSARVAVHCDVTDDAERGRTDPEVEAGDAGPPGELAAHLRVELRRADDGRLVYEGTLDDFGARAEGIPLSDTCLDPGVHRLHLRWHLPVDAPDVIQTDAVRFSLRFAAAACAADAP